MEFSPEKMKYNENQEDLISFEQKLDASRPHFERLLEQLKPSLQEGRWSSFLVDDTGGRIVGRVLHKILQNESSRKNVPKFYFYPGGIDIEKRLPWIREHIIQKHKTDFGSRALLVTDYMDTGMSIEAMARLLRGDGIFCDVATLTYRSEREAVKRLPGDMTLFSGGKGRPHFWKDRQVLGVVKAYDDDSETADIMRDPRVNQASFNEVRQKTIAFADDLYAKIFQNQEKKSQGIHASSVV